MSEVSKAYQPLRQTPPVEGKTMKVVRLDVIYIMHSEDEKQEFKQTIKELREQGYKLTHNSYIHGMAVYVVASHLASRLERRVK